MPATFSRVVPSFRMLFLVKGDSFLSVLVTRANTFWSAIGLLPNGSHVHREGIIKARMKLFNY